MAGEQLNMESTPETSSVYVQHTKGKDMMTISFEYSLNGKKKSFNLYRKPDESLQDALVRLRRNVGKLNKVKKSKIEEPDEDPDLTLILKLNGCQIDPATTKNVDAWVEGATMEINGESFVIKRNQPQVTLMKLPSIIMKGFITVPYVDLANCDIKDCKFIWFRQISAAERDARIASDPEAKIELDHQKYWLHLATGLTYSPSDGDVAHQLKVVCQPSCGAKVGPLYSCISGGMVELGPLRCPFEKRQTFTNNKFVDRCQFRIVSYNILADLYADSAYSRTVLFAHCPPNALEIDYRRQLILKEIDGYNADIVCLQEVDKREFNKTYEPYFKLVIGHKGVFDTKGGQVAEGVATFFREDKFELIDSHKTVLSRLIDPNAVVERDSGLDEEIPLKEQDGDNPESTIEASQSQSKPHPILDDLNSPSAIDILSRIATIRDKIKSNVALTKRFMGRHTVLQTNLLKFKDMHEEYLLVANTHLYFAPDADHIRLLQGGICVNYIQFLKGYYRSLIKAKFGDQQPNISVIFCGDMNSTPDCGLYKLLHEGHVDDKLPDWSSNQNESIHGLSLQTALRMSSAYKNIPYTNFTPGFSGCLDYIYYELSCIDCESTVPMPDHEDVIASEGIPSDVFPSDHLALVANLRIKR